MTLLDKILNIIKTDDDNEQEIISNIESVLLTFFNIITLIASVLFCIVGIIARQKINAIVIIGAILLLVINLILIVKNKFIELTKYFYLIIVGIVSIYILINPSPEIMIIIFLTFPIDTFLILGKSKGNKISLGLFFISILVMFLPYFTPLEPSLSIGVIFLLLTAYIALHYIIYVYVYLKEKQIKVITDSLNSSKNIIKQKDKFLSKLSHQIRTPLNNIMVVTNLVNNAEMDQKQRDLIDTIQASANNLANVVNNISEFSTVEISESSEYNIDFELFETINNTLKIFTQQNEEKIHFKINIPQELTSNIQGNPIKIKQIFLNLIESILKNKTELEINIDVTIGVLKKTGNNLKVLFEIISDQPLQAPIDESKQKYISTIETSAKNKQGDLINLLDISIANRIVELENEKIAIDISNEKTVFSFALNLSHGEPEISEKHKVAESEHGRAPNIPLNESNVLLVEDNIINQKIVILSLKKSVKNIDIANNGKEALDMFGTSKYDLILMDIQMPIMNGIVTTKKIREIESSTNTHTPIIAITANALLGDKENCLAAGMDDYISKPFQIEILLKKMESQLSNL